MKNKTLIQLWVAFKIWIIAVAINVLAGSLYLSDFEISNGLKEYAGIGFAFSVIFSFPIFLILFFIIKRCVRNNIYPRKIFAYILFASVVSTVIVFLLFSYSLSIGQIISPLFFIAFLSCMISIGSQYKSIRRLTPKTETMNENVLK